MTRTVVWFSFTTMTRKGSISQITVAKTDRGGVESVGEPAVGQVLQINASDLAQADAAEFRQHSFGHHLLIAAQG